MPRELEADHDIDREFLNDDDLPYDKLMKMLGDDEGDEDEQEAFGKTSEDAEPVVDKVTVDEGADLVENADSARREKKAAPKPEVTDETPAPEDDAAEPNPEEGEAKDADEIDTLLAGVADDARASIRSRITAADEVMAHFKGRMADLERAGVSPAQAVGELLKIESYARSNPSEYLAWAASQMGGNPVEMITKAAERLGLKVSADQSDDDPFEDPDIKAMRDELAQYRQRDASQTIGPNAPQNQVMSDLESFKAGAQHFDALAPYIAAQASAHVQATGRPATMEDIQRFYNASVQAAGLADVGQKTTPAAQARDSVQQSPQKPAATPSDSVKRAMAASKSLDGSGHGAGRRPALAEDAPVNKVLSHFWKDGD